MHALPVAAAVSGLCGSRANVVYTAIIALGLVHLLWRPVRRRTVVALAVVGLTFMYVYGFYKVAGAEGVAESLSADSRGQLEQSSGRDLQALLVQDLGRADVQAYELYRYRLPHSDFRPVHGATYVSGVTALVPSRLLPVRPPGKLQAGTDLFYGQGTYATTGFSVQNIYGLSGEAILNFGPWSIPFAFVVLGVAVRAAQRFTGSLVPGDSRLVLVPVLGVACVLLLTSDLGNVAYALVQFGLLLAVLVLLGSGRADKARQRALGVEQRA